MSYNHQIDDMSYRLPRQILVAIEEFKKNPTEENEIELMRIIADGLDGAYYFLPGD